MTDTDVSRLVQTVGESFSRAAPNGWVKAQLVLRQVGKTFEFQSTASLAGGDEVRFRMPPAAIIAFSDMRDAMGQAGKGAWFTATCHIEAPGRITFDFDYDNEPQWSTPTSVGHYLEEWEKHPRAPEHTPEWLAERLRQAHEWDAQTR